MKNENSKKKKVGKYLLFAIIIVIIALIIYIKYKSVFEKKKTYTVVNGYVEEVSDTTGVVVKDENVIKTDKSKSIVTVVDQNKRVSKNGTIAIYKDESYDKYLSEINELDKTIASLVKDLPNIYSIEVSNINQQISSISNQSKNETSYLKMLEYKNKLDELSYKKIRIIGEHSPSGSKIRELIEQREKKENTVSKSSNVIKSPISGVVSYKLDNLEDYININDVTKYDTEKIDELLYKYSNNDTNEYGVKIVDNFKAYIIAKTEKDQTDKYIKIGNEYKIKTIEQNVNEFSGKLIKNIQSDKYNYSFFEINNGIENIVDCRVFGVEVVWKRTEGLAVLKSAIDESSDGKYKYITLVYGGQYIQLPIKIKSSDENIAIVENYSKEELKNFGYESNVSLSLYDIIVVK